MEQSDEAFDKTWVVGRCRQAVGLRNTLVPHGTVHKSDGACRTDTSLSREAALSPAWLGAATLTPPPPKKKNGTQENEFPVCPSPRPAAFLLELTRIYEVPKRQIALGSWTW